MPKIRQTNKVMKVGNQWLPAFLNSVNGSPTYTYMNDSGQWADASGNTYSVVQPLDEVTVKYDPKTGGQINKAAPDYWRQYGQRRMQQTAGNVDKVIMGTVGAATAPLWLPEIYGAGLVLGGNPAVQQFTNQVLYGLGADAALKATTGYDYSEAGQRLFSPVLQRIGLSQGTSDIIGQVTGDAMNPGYYMPAMKLNAQKILDPVADYLREPLPEYSKRLQILNDAVYPTIGTIVGGVAGNQISKQDVLPEYMKPYAEPVGMLLGGGAGSLLKYAAIPNSYVSDMLRYPIIAPYEMARGNYVQSYSSDGAPTNKGEVSNSMQPLSVETLSYYEMNPVLRKLPEYETHYNNVKNRKVSPEAKAWMSNPEEWHAEYNNIINRVTNGKVVPVSDLTRDQRDAAINYFMSRFGSKKKSAEQALDMINAYQRDFLQGNRIHTVNTPRTDNTIVFAPSDTPTLIQ